MSNWYYKREVREDGRAINIATTVCTVCGAEYRNGNVASSLYCPDCAKRIRAEKNRERVRRFREKNKRDGS